MPSYSHILAPTIVNVELKLLHENFKTGHWPNPEYATSGSAAFDLLAAIDEPVTIEPLETQFISTGLSIWIKDPNYAVIMMPRSGKGSKQGIVLAATLGLIDSDYQGTLMMCVLNRSKQSVTISPGDYIAQAIIVPVPRAKFIIVDEFSDVTERGLGGFGSTKS